MSQTVKCLNAKGWSATIGPTGEIGYTGASAQSDAYNKSLRDCLHETGMDISPPPLTDDQLRQLYQFHVKLADCVRKQGYTAPTPPSVQSFIDSRGANYSGYDGVNPRDLTQDQWVELNQKCPQNWEPSK